MNMNVASRLGRLPALARIGLCSLAVIFILSACAPETPPVPDEPPAQAGTADTPAPEPTAAPLAMIEDTPAPQPEAAATPAPTAVPVQEPTAMAAPTAQPVAAPTAAVEATAAPGPAPTETPPPASTPLPRRHGNTCDVGAAVDCLESLQCRPGYYCYDNRQQPSRIDAGHAD